LVGVIVFTFLLDQKAKKKSSLAFLIFVFAFRHPELVEGSLRLLIPLLFWRGARMAGW
jgi:hypothetical protein